MSNHPALALFQPDIPGNAGTLLRLAACLDFDLHVIFPCGFLWDDKRMRRSGMDYLDKVRVLRHAAWEDFLDHAQARQARLVLMTTKAQDRLTDFIFQKNDIIIVGRESAGVPEQVDLAAQARLRIPLAAGMRSLNVAVAATMAMAEALRQTQGFPP